jgi:hypothetical protein
MLLAVDFILTTRSIRHADNREIVSHHCFTAKPRQFSF